MAFIEAENLSKVYVRHNAPKTGGISRLWPKVRAAAQSDLVGKTGRFWACFFGISKKLAGSCGL